MGYFLKAFLACLLVAGGVSAFAAGLSDPLPSPLTASASTSDGAPTPTLSHAKVSGRKLTFALTLDKIPVQQLIMLFYDQCEKRGLVFDPAINKLDDVLTIKTPSLTCDQTRVILVDSVARVGIGFESHGSYDVVRQVKPRDEHEGWEQFIYRPRFRDPVELADQCLIAMRKGSFAHQRRVSSVQVATPAASQPQQVPDTGSNGASLTTKAIDKLIFYGPPNEAEAVRSLLQILDVPYGQVEINAAVYEYQSGTATGSAVSAMIQLFNAKLGLSISGGAAAGAATAGSPASTATANTLSLNLSNFSAALALLDQDTRFRDVSRPKVLARDGQQVVFTTGQDVRVTGSVTMNASGQSVQSMTDVTAGVTFQVTPVIRGDAVDVALHETVSDFVPSPNSDPSILKRDLVTDLMMRPGLVYVIGGLNTSSKTTSRQRFFGIPIGDNFDSNDTEIILLMTVTYDQTGV